MNLPPEKNLALLGLKIFYILNIVVLYYIMLYYFASYCIILI